MSTKRMNKAKRIFQGFTIIFQPLYFLMLLMYYDQLQTEKDPLAITLDIAICILGIIFMFMQLMMFNLVGNIERKQRLRKIFFAGLVIWFTLEVVLSYWWCFVTGHDPLVEHTPFVLIFLVFNYAQYCCLKMLDVI